MSDLNLDAVRARYASATLPRSSWSYASASADDVPALVAEIERLRGTVVEYQWGVQYSDDSGWSSCDWCGNETIARDKAERTQGELVRRVVGQPEPVQS